MTNTHEDWDLEFIPQSFRFEVFKKGTRMVTWGIVLWPSMEPFFVDIMDHNDPNVSLFGGSQYYSTYQDALDCVLGYLEMSFDEYTQFHERDDFPQQTIIRQMMQAVNAK